MRSTQVFMKSSFRFPVLIKALTVCRSVPAASSAGTPPRRSWQVTRWRGELVGSGVGRGRAADYCQRPRLVTGGTASASRSPDRTRTRLTRSANNPINGNAAAGLNLDTCRALTDLLTQDPVAPIPHDILLRTPPHVHRTAACRPINN